MAKKKAVELHEMSDDSLAMRLTQLQMDSEKNRAEQVQKKEELEELKISFNGMQSLQMRIKREQQRRIEDKERMDAYADYPNVTESTKNKVWSKAYEMEHSSGMHEVRNRFRDLMELFEE